jgi:hypothetical protein
MPLLDWNILLNNYREYFPGENFFVKSYDKASLKTDEDLYHSFFSISNVSLDQFTIPKLKDKANKGFSPIALEFAKIANKVLSGDEKKKFRYFLQEHFAKKSLEDYSYFSNQERWTYMNQYKVCNDLLARSYPSKFLSFFEEVNLSDKEIIPVTISSDDIIQLVLKLHFSRKEDTPKVQFPRSIQMLYKIEHAFAKLFMGKK